MLIGFQKLLKLKGFAFALNKIGSATNLKRVPQRQMHHPTRWKDKKTQKASKVKFAQVDSITFNGPSPTRFVQSTSKHLMPLKTPSQCFRPEIGILRMLRFPSCGKHWRHSSRMFACSGLHCTFILISSKWRHQTTCSSFPLLLLAMMNSVLIFCFVLISNELPP